MLRGIIDYTIEADLRVRNAYRIEQTKQAMGEKYIHHPANYVKRKKRVRPILSTR